MNSFYGGPNGASFKISKIFNSIASHNNTSIVLFNDNFETYEDGFDFYNTTADFYFFDDKPFKSKFQINADNNGKYLSLCAYRKGTNTERAKIDFSHNNNRIKGEYTFQFDFQLIKSHDNDRPGFTFNPFGGYYFNSYLPENANSVSARFNVRRANRSNNADAYFNFSAKIGNETQTKRIQFVDKNGRSWNPTTENWYTFIFNLKLNEINAEIYQGNELQASLKSDEALNQLFGEETINAFKEQSISAFMPEIIEGVEANYAYNDSIVNLDNIQISQPFVAQPNDASLIDDLKLRWQSNIGVDEYVLVSYGLPTENNNYSYYQKLDNGVYNKDYNATLWQKIYEEEAGKEDTYSNSSKYIFANSVYQGWGYKFIGSLAGETPYFTITHRPVEASEERRIELSFANDGNSINRPILTFFEPKPWSFVDNIEEDLEASEQMTIDFYGIDKNQEKINNDNDPHSTKKFEVHLSEPWKFGFTKRTLEANETPTADFYAVEGDNVTNNNNATSRPNATNKEHSIKHLDIALPKAWDFTHNLQTDLEASENATMNFYGIDENGEETTEPHSTKKLEIHLPKAWQFEKAEDEVLRANDKPKVEFEAIDEDPSNPGHSKKRFTFSLPEAWDIEHTTSYKDPLDDKGIYQPPTVDLSTSTANETSIKTLEFTLPRPIQITASQQKAISRGDTKVTTTYTSTGIDFNFAIYDPQDLDIKEPIGPFNNEKLWISYWEENLIDWLNQNYSNLNQNAILPVTYNMIDEMGQIIKSDSYWIYKTEQNSDGTWNWYYSQFGGVELVNERVDDDTIAENTTYSAKMINTYLDEVDRANEALNAIKTAWHIYYDEDIETAVMLNVLQDYNENTGIVEINGATTSMVASLDQDTLVINYPTLE